MTEALARLTPKTQNWDRIPGGLSELAGAEMAAVLAGLPRGPYLLARACWIDDQTVIEELERVAMVEATKFVRHDKILYADMLRNMCSIAIQSAVTPRRCEDCEGRCVVYGKLGVIAECGACSGSGRSRRGGKAIARALSLKPSDWTKVRQSYADVENLLTRWQNVASAHIRAKLQAEKIPQGY